MQLLSKEVFVPAKDGRCPFPGFIHYISDTQPILMHRYGWVDGDDCYDDFSDYLSHDNGQTWGAGSLRLRGQTTPQGRNRYAENAAFFDSKRRRLHTITTYASYEPDKPISRNHWQLEFNHYDVATGQWGQPWRSRLGHEQSGLMLSFSQPIFLNDDLVLVPAQKPQLDDKGNIASMPGYYHALLEALVLIGRRNARGDFDWSTSKPATISTDLSSRGLVEPAVAQLKDGSLIMICRGDNGVFPEKPGYKWVCRSHDQGQTWGPASPLTLSDGTNIESPSSGSMLFRSIKDGQLYWMGNLAIEGQRARGNWPRKPLVLARVQEEPLGLVRDSFLIVDRQQPGEPDRVQMSNFRFHQDRSNGDLVIFLTRFGERDASQFKDADYYRYRVRLDD